MRRPFLFALSGSALSVLGLIAAGCASDGERFARETSTACTTGDRFACETLATMHPQALRDADAILEGMRQAQAERLSFQRATQ